jgi:hypothetical protein
MVPKTKIKFPIKTIVIANITEFYRPLFRQFHEKEKVTSWIKPSQAECDMALLWAGDDKLVIVPKKIDDYFLCDLLKTLKYNNVHIVYPDSNSESLCLDIEKDVELFNFIVDVINNSEIPQIIGWGATLPFYDLLKSLEKAGGNFTSPEIPSRDDYWTVPYLDSKIGFREMFAKLSLKMSGGSIAPGLICATTELATAVIKSNYFQDTGIVVKSNDGVGGYGTLIYRQERLRDVFDFGKKLETISRLMPIFSSTPLLVEKFINSQSQSVISSPSIQGMVYPSGNVEITALAGQIVDNIGKYIGAIISPGIFPPHLQKSLYAFGYKLGTEAARLGYRGVFNFDTILADDGQLYFVEMNARRTSVKYILDMATQLFGKTWINKMSFISNERFSSTELKKFSYLDIRSLLSDFLFPIAGTPQGIIITISSSLVQYTRIPQLGFVVIGDSFSDTQNIYSGIYKLLND